MTGAGPRALVGVVVAGLLAVGCTEGNPEGRRTAESETPTATPTPTPTGKRLPVRITSAGPEPVESEEIEKRLGPEPGDDATVTEQVLYEMRERAINDAGVDGETSAACEGGRVELAPDAYTECTVTYEGVRIPVGVLISDDYEPGDSLIEYDASPDMVIVRADVAVGRFWADQGERGVEVRCSRMPRVFLIDDNEKTPYQCQRPSLTDPTKWDHLRLITESGEWRWVYD